MNVIAHGGDGIYLLDIGDGRGVVLHTRTNPPTIFAPKSIAAHSKWGYWQEFEGDPAPILAAAAAAKLAGDTMPAPRIIPHDHAVATRGGFRQGDVHLVDAEGNERPVTYRPLTDAP